MPKNTAVVVIAMIGILFGSTALAGIAPSFVALNEMEMPGSAAVSLDFSPPTVTDDGAYTVVASRECECSLTEQGHPVLPYRTMVLTFPPGTTIEQVTARVPTVYTMRLDKKITPAPRAVSANMQPANPVVVEGDVYHSTACYPSDWLSYSIGVGKDGSDQVIFLSLQMYPVRYRPAASELVYIEHIDIDIQYEPSSSPLRQIDEYDLLIVAPSQFTESLQSFVQHKQDIGVATQLVTLDDVYSGAYFDVNGRDDAEQVKYFIKNAVESWGIDYVLLVGGRNGGFQEAKWWCPVRYTNLDANDGDRQFLSDLYFSDLYRYDDGDIVFEDWDPNGNDLFGEYTLQTREDIDMYPDVYLGRWPCRTAFEVDTMVEKTITYETTAHGQDWAKRYVGIGADTFPGDQWYDGEVTVTNVTEYLTPLGYDFDTLFYSESPYSGSDIIDTISEGCGLLQFEGHGTPTSWASHGPNSQEWDVYLNVLQFPLLKNRGMYPICVVGGCSNSKFDITILDLLDFEHLQENIAHGSIGLECFSWWMTRKVDGGSIATIGCTSYGYGTRGDSNQDGIFDGIQIRGGFIDIEFFRVYAQEGKNTLGAAHGQALTNFQIKFPFLDGHDDQIEGKTLQEWTLFGDPSLKIGGYF
ncbi:MAG: C25 family cysteine peptidase [Thermoplasmatota archaeon]